MVEIKLANPTAELRGVWIEPAAYMLKLEPNTEYKLVTDDRSFRIEFDSNYRLTLWTDTTVGFVLYKFELVNDMYDWVVMHDCSNNRGSL